MTKAVLTKKPVNILNHETLGTETVALLTKLIDSRPIDQLGVSRYLVDVDKLSFDFKRP